MDIQEYGEGKIRRNNASKYEYVVADKVVGIYDNVAGLVNANPVKVQAASSEAAKAPVKKSASKKASK